MAAACTDKITDRMTSDVAKNGCRPQAVGVWTIRGIFRMLLMTSEHLAGTNQSWVLVAVRSYQPTSGCTAHLVVITPGTSKSEISTTREAAQVGNTTIVEANAVETRKGVGRRIDTPREIETETGSVTQTAQEIETGIVAATETESTRKRGGPTNHLIMSMS
jgi:hypothetical protein